MNRTQLDIFRDGPPARARRTDPETSHEAAALVDVGILDKQLLACLGRFEGGTTMQNVALELRRELVCVSPRFRPLARRGLLRDTGRREKGGSGRRRIVWEVVKP